MKRFLAAFESSPQSLTEALERKFSGTDADITVQFMPYDRGSGAGHYGAYVWWDDAPKKEKKD